MQSDPTSRQLNRQEHEQYSRLKLTQNGTDEKTFELGLRYYLQYTHGASNIPLEKIQIALKCALFMAEKSQCIYNLKGEKTSLPALSLNQLLKTHKLDDIMITLKDFTKRVDITDRDASNDLANLIKEISFLITFHKKFEKIAQKLQLKERLPETNPTDYLKIFSSFIWLVYIQAKNKVLSRSLQLIDNTCMLAHSIAFMINYGWDYILPSGLLKTEKRLTQASRGKQVFIVIRQKILEMFSIKTMDIFASVAHNFQKFFEEELINTAIIKCSNGKQDFLSPELIVMNYKRLDKRYEKTMGFNDLDERIFFRDRAANLTPSKFTPFARQGYANKGKGVRLGNNLAMNDGTVNKQTSAPYRILNYEMIDKQETTHKNNNNMVDIKLPKSVMQSPSMMKVPLICSTPITTGMEMFNYINEKARKFKEMLSQGNAQTRPFEQTAFKCIETVYEKSKKDHDKKSKQIRISLIYSLYKLGLEQYLLQHPQQKDNQQMFKGLMAVSIEIVLFVNNSNFTFEDIERQVGTDSLSLWKAFDFYLKFDKSMPSALKLHLLDIEVGLVSYKIWRQGQLEDMINSYVRGQRDESRGQFTQRLFKRILHQTAFQITQLCSSLKLEDYLTQNIYETLKFMLGCKLNVMMNKHLDQMIMCAIFANCKKEKIDIKFSEIIETYIELNQHNKEMHDGLIYKIVVEERQPITLIHLHNQYVVREIKQFVLSLGSDHNSSTHSQVQAQNNHKRSNQTNATHLLQSPLKDILPRHVNKVGANRKNAQIKGNGEQPSTQNHLLYAYSESPMLKQQALTFNKPLQSKKLLNFDKQEEQLLKKKEDKDETEKSPRNVPNQFNAKKFSASNNPMGMQWKSSQLVKQAETARQPEGLTPNRPAKTSAHQTSQFNSNPPMSSNPTYLNNNNYNAPTVGQFTHKLNIHKPNVNGFGVGVNKMSSKYEYR